MFLLRAPVTGLNNNLSPHRYTVMHHYRERRIGASAYFPCASACIGIFGIFPLRMPAVGLKNNLSPYRYTPDLESGLVACRRISLMDRRIGVFLLRIGVLWHKMWRSPANESALCSNSCMLAVAAQRALACSLLELPLAAADECDGTEPPLGDLLADARDTEPVHASRTFGHSLRREQSNKVATNVALPPEGWLPDTLLQVKDLVSEFSRAAFVEAVKLDLIILDRKKIDAICCRRGAKCPFPHSMETLSKQAPNINVVSIVPMVAAAGAGTLLVPMTANTGCASSANWSADVQALARAILQRRYTLEDKKLEMLKHFVAASRRRTRERLWSSRQWVVHLFVGKGPNESIHFLERQGFDVLELDLERGKSQDLCAPQNTFILRRCTTPGPEPVRSNDTHMGAGTVSLQRTLRW
ncbi:unnamed protein product [Symbiodinium sp. KB8]|nr:unnamed protein product [Symbiodinium sp. KB8]